ncbi:MAG: DivIVA domain-containing protein [Armatimonadetes bacterium]|jgi:cell division initiation protein|nr:DivIVA domain-containing protein [Armatimonadota bacterium]
MRLAPLDIYNKEFPQAVIAGYRKPDVDAFLEEVARDYEALTRENIELRQQVEEMGKRLADYARLEESIRKALVMAQSTADEARASARREGELMLQEARQEAARIQEAAREQVRREEEESIRLRQQRERFILEFGGLLRTYLAALEHATKADSE